MYSADPAPQSLVIGRRTYFDFGPPFEFLEVFLIEPSGSGLSVERLALTPAGAACQAPASLLAASTTTRESMDSLLSEANPCSIPEKALKREKKRCKNCLTFSGADVTMRIRCGGETRDIRMDILDRDLFDQNARTPEHTSWSMSVLNKLDGLLGSQIADGPAFVSADETQQSAQIAETLRPAQSQHLRALQLGEFDSLFVGSREKASDVYAQSRVPARKPTVELVGTLEDRPRVYSLPEYPALAKQARIEGPVAFRAEVGPDGRVTKVEFVQGNPLLRSAVRKALADWRYAAAGTGRTVELVLQFKTNCPGAP